mgnify:CR=1 FL=1
MRHQPTKTSRRSFIKKSAAIGTGIFVLPRFSIGKPGQSANSKVNVAMIGAGGIASQAYQGSQGENGDGNRGAAEAGA